MIIIIIYIILSLILWSSKYEKTFFIHLLPYFLGSIKSC